MDAHQHKNEHPNQYNLKTFAPLIIIFALITAFTLIKQFLSDGTLHTAMTDFMGSFFIVFGAFKVINLHGFAEAYSIYDIVAKQFRAYAYAYPFIELALGVAYLTRYQHTMVNWVTLILMIVSSIGVAQELAQKKEIPCACLGVVFKIPMTYVTLLEDFLMGAMAALMLMYP